MPDKEIMLQIRQREEARPWSLFDRMPGLGPDGPSGADEDFAQALAWLAEDWRATADLYQAAKLKGAASAHILPLRHAAQQLEQVIKGLSEPRRAPLGQLQPPKHESAGLAEPRHRFEVGPGASGSTCTAMVERDGAGDQCGRFASHPAHRLDAPTERPGLDALIAEASGAMKVDSVHVNGEDVTAYLRGDVDTLPGPDLGPSSVRDQTDPADDDPLIKETPNTVTATPPGPVPPVPLLGQPGDAGTGYAPTYVPPGGVPISFAELLTLVPAAALPAHLSHSQIETIADCPTKYRAQRLPDTDSIARSVVQIPQWALIGGGAFHAAVEQMERFAITTGAPPDTDPAEIWRYHFDAECQKIEATSPVPRARWRASKQGAEGETWWNANGPEMLRRYLAARPTEPTATIYGGAPEAIGDSAIAIELERDVQVQTPYGPVPYKAIIDRVTVRQAGDPMRGSDYTELIIRDYKTGATMPDSTSQLGEYAQVLRLLGVPPQVKILGTYFNARKGTWTPEVDLEAEGWTSEWFAWLVASAYGQRLALTTGPTAARPSNFCGGCSVRWACPVKGVKAGGGR